MTLPSQAESLTLGHHMYSIESSRILFGGLTCDGLGWRVSRSGSCLVPASPRRMKSRTRPVELQGGWRMVLLFVNGEEIPADQAKSGELVVVDDEYRPKLGATVEASTFKIDATKNPKAIDFTYTSGFSKGQDDQGHLQD